MFLTSSFVINLYLFSISLTTHPRTEAAFFASVITGHNKCGIPSYVDSSNILVSIKINSSARFFEKQLDQKFTLPVLKWELKRHDDLVKRCYKNKPCLEDFDALQESVFCNGLTLNSFIEKRNIYPH